MEYPFEYEILEDLEAYSHFEFDPIRLIHSVRVPWPANFFADQNCLDLEGVAVENASDPAFDVPNMHPRTHPIINILLMMVRPLRLEHMRILRHVIVVEIEWLL